MASRITILTKEEINSLYSIPKFEDKDRTVLFHLDEDDLEFLETLKNDVPRKVNYILQLGYYRAVNYFFQFSFQKQLSDVTFIIDQYFSDSPIPKKQISKNYHYENRAQVMKKYGIADTSQEFEEKLHNQARLLAKRHILPKFILQELLSFCLQENVVRPSYSKMQKVVAASLKKERSRLINFFYTDTDKELRDNLDALLESDDLFYKLTLLKRDQKDFSTTEIKNSVGKREILIDIYKQSLWLMPKLGISEQNIIYYADLAEFYTIQKLRQLKNKNQARLYLFCYAYRRFLKINNHLVTSFAHKALKFTNEGNDYKSSKLEAHESIGKSLKKQVGQLLAINIDENIPDNKIRETAFGIVPEDSYKQFLKDFNKPDLNANYYRWEYYESKSPSIKRNLRPLFGALEFTCEKQSMSDAATFLRKHIASNSSFSSYRYKDVPLGHFPKSLRKLMTYKLSNAYKDSRKRINGNRYEFMVYLQLSKGLADGSVFVKDSISYRALEDELINKEYWKKHKAKILAELNMPLLSTDISELLNNFQTSLSDKYKRTNDRIQNGENTSIVIKRNKEGEIIKWTLPYTRVDDAINNPFYEQLPTTSIGDILKFAANDTGFMNSFTHLQPVYAKVKPDLEVISACIIANATGIESNKMKEISDIKGSDFDNADKNFMRSNSLDSASEVIINHTAKLSIFNEYNLSDYGVHASVDGQKLSTRYNTIKSRYSKKYLGMKKGVVVYSLIANHTPISLKVIGANEHESHFLLDIAESNTSDVEIYAISGDMHSINRVIPICNQDTDEV